MTSLPTHWPVERLDDVVEILDRQRVPVNAKERAKRRGDVPYYGARGKVGTIDKAIFDEPLVLLGEDGVPFLDPLEYKAYLISGPAWVNNHAHVLRPHAALDRRWLAHWLNVVDYRERVTGTTRLKLNQTRMRDLPVPVPPLDDQKRIVAEIERLLSKVDHAATTIRAMPTRAKRLEQASAAQVFSTAGTPMVAVGDLLADIQAGVSFKCPGHEAAPDKPGVLKLGAVTWGEFRQRENKEIPAHLDPDPDHEVKVGDLIIGRANTSEHVGATALVRATRPGLYLSDKTLRLVPDKGVPAEWLKLMLAAPQTRAHLSSVATGTSDSMRNISQAKIKATKVPGVPGNWQDLVDAHAAWRGAAARLAAMGETQTTRVTALRRSILKAAFEGRL